MKSKKDIRTRILKIRSQLDKADAARLSELICRRVMESREYGGAHDICLYMAINNEVELSYMTEKAWKCGKRLWLPRVIDGEMSFFSYTEKTRLLKGAFGIMEPDSCEVLEPEDSTLVIMPGAVFSKTRDRIGYGGGYYDRFLDENPQVMTAAVCYDFQILDAIPAEKHDVKPHMVISEKRVFI